MQQISISDKVELIKARSTLAKKIRNQYGRADLAKKTARLIEEKTFFNVRCKE